MSVNAALAERLGLMSRMMDLMGEDSFRSLAYAKAARSLVNLSTDVEPIAKAPDAKKRLTELEGIGPRMADKIIEFVSTGTIRELDEMRAKMPVGLLGVMEIPGLGPKTVAVLWKQGGVESIADLKRIIADGSILKLPRMGATSVAKIKESIAAMEQAGGAAQRLHLGVAVPVAERIIETMLKVPGVEQAAYAGSARRGRDTVGDLDILVAVKSPEAAQAVSEAFRTMPQVKKVLVAGDTKSSVQLVVRPDLGRWSEGEGEQEHGSPGVQADLRVIGEGCWGAALMYFTGSKEHNVRLRERALKMGVTLNEYGLFPDDGEKEPPQKRGVKCVAAKTEEEVYAKLGLAWIPPEMREDRGEFDVFELEQQQHPERKRGGKESSPKATPAKPSTGRASKVPKPAAASNPGSRPIEIADIKAELHAHTTASDGVMSILQLAMEAKQRGFHTIAVTDHSKSSAIAGGLSPDRLHRHIADVRAANQEIEGITILAGSEVDILADGSLDYDDDLLAELDIVVASPHAGLRQDPAAATARLLRAIQHPAVRILGHPTGRKVNRRPGISPDIADIAAAAKEHNVALEINAHWMRLDLRDDHVRIAVEKGALIAIDCDVHYVEDFDNLRYGVATARRGWVTAEVCVNTWSAEKLLAWVASKRR